MATRFQRLFVFNHRWPELGPTLRACRGPAIVLPLLLLLPVALVPATGPAAEPVPGRATVGAGSEVLLGQSAPFSGPSAELGRDYREGAMAWFAEVNRRGGIHGRRLRLLSLDDRYEPLKTLRNTRQLIEDDRVFALFGYVGTPTVKAILPLVDRARIPLVAPLTGARLVREPQRPMVFNLRASYQAEIDRIVNDLVRAGRHRIAVLHQEDAFGEDGLRATTSALARHGLRPVAIAGVRRNSTATDRAARQVQRGQPNAVVIISAYPSSAAFSRSLQSLGSTAQLMNVSFVGTGGLQNALPAGTANGIGVSQVVPFPWDRRVPVVAEYLRLMRQQQRSPRYGFTSLEGFLAARLLTEALQRAGANPTRQGLVSAFESMGQLDLGGFRISLGPRDHQASDFVDLTFLGAQRWAP
jgi:ABC-type branched-subunit amino acid transport system substrate-binding protein